MSVAIRNDTELVYKDLDLAVKQVDPEKRRIKFVASQQLIDRDEDVIVVAGVDIADFMLNPILLADHDRTFPIGKVISLRVERRPEGQALVGEAEILPSGVSERIDEVWAAIKFGARNGISIGFRPLEVGAPILEGQRGRTYFRVKLYELSNVTLPSNASALIEEKRARSYAGAEVFEVDEYMLDRVLTETVAWALAETTKEAVTAAINARRGLVD